MGNGGVSAPKILGAHSAGEVRIIFFLLPQFVIWDRNSAKKINWKFYCTLKVAVLDHLMSAQRLIIHRPGVHEGDDMDNLPPEILSGLGSLENMGERKLVVLLDCMHEEFGVFDDVLTLRGVAQNGMMTRFPVL
ncbi:uncharacterized protein LOC132202414 isoform X2 [Neocloeon triangulifer]|uniref:uncharacterized protein LOC132202414 isoform X2 n=1 Tax=Neocloeon triangulifer TaxID=2078957 RepID=UPI00286EE244|nr:uncharacterized protein LOC132202414 isoform X2 [Neocloeon triangulifer]